MKSLQYDELEAGLERLEKVSRRSIIRSPADQKVDVDGFATSVASTRGVITVSNTTAHMAGALGKPCAVILDDLDDGSWPTVGDRTPFYPELRLVRRRARDWASVLDEAAAVLNDMIQV